METLLITALIALIGSAFFSGMEMAFVSANKYKVGLLKTQKNLTSRIVSRFYNKQSAFLSTILLGNNIALVIFGIALAKMVGLWFDPSLGEFNLLLIQTAISTVIVLLIGEFLPKILFRINPSGTLKFFSVPFQAIYFILFIPVVIIERLSKGIIKLLFKQEISEERPVYSKVDLGAFVKDSVLASGDDDDELNAEIFERALHLNNVKIRECMIPRPEVEGMDVGCTMEELVQSFVDTRHSRILIYKENMDNVLGYIHHQDMLKNPSSKKGLINEIKVVPETLAAQDLMDEFIKENVSIARVVDEFGGTAGIVTLEDILEEIFGEIEDEHDDPEFVEQQIAKDEFLFAGRLEIDYLNEKYELNIPDGEYETLTGYIFDFHESIPRNGEVIYTEDFEISILSSQNARIDLVKLKVKDQ